MSKKIKNRPAMDDLALVVGAEMIAASSFAADETICSLKIPFSPDWAERLRQWCENELDVSAPDLETTFLVTAASLNERTRLLALDAEILQLDGEQLNEYLVKAAESGASGTNGEPLFFSNGDFEYLEEMACAFVKLPNGQLSATEVPRSAIRATGRDLLALAGISLDENLPPEMQPAVRLRVETPSRAVLRRYLAHQDAHQEQRQAAAAIALWIVTENTHHIALWSPSWGLFDELGEPLFISRENDSDENYNSDLFAAAEGDAFSETAFDEVENTDKSFAEMFSNVHPEQEIINRALDELFLKLRPHSLSEFAVELEGVLWIAAPSRREQVLQAINTTADSNVAFEEIPGNLYEVIAEGLLLGSQQPEEAWLETLNLANDVRVQAETAEIQQQAIRLKNFNRERRKVIWAMFAPLALMLAFVVGTYTDMVRTGFSLAWRNAAADVEKDRLKPLLDAQASYNASFDYYLQYLQQTFSLRDKQGIPISLFEQLDERFPGDLDSAFYLSDVRLNNKGQLEITGLARDEMAVTQFVRQLEFASDAKGKKLFVGLQPEIRRGGETLSSSAPSPFGASPVANTMQVSNLPPGVIAFQIKGYFSPVGTAASKPAATAAQPPVAAPGHNAAANQTAANTPTAVNGGNQR